MEWKTLPNADVIRNTFSGFNITDTSRFVGGFIVGPGHCGAMDGSRIIVSSSNMDLNIRTSVVGTAEASTLYWIWLMATEFNQLQMWMFKQGVAPSAQGSYEPVRAVGVMWSQGGDRRRIAGGWSQGGGNVDRNMLWIGSNITRRPLAWTGTSVSFDTNVQREASFNADLRTRVPEYPFGGYGRVDLVVTANRLGTRAIPETMFIGDREISLSGTGTTNLRVSNLQIPDSGILPVGIRSTSGGQGRGIYTYASIYRTDFSLAVGSG